MQYSYADGSNNTIRITGGTYPSGRNVVDDYGTSGSINDAASRILGMRESGASTNLVQYEYLGLGGFVNTEYPEPSLENTLIGSGNDPDTGDIYHGLDRFGRVKDALWQTTGGTPTAKAQIQYGYDRVSKNGVRLIIRSASPVERTPAAEMW